MSKKIQQTAMRYRRSFYLSREFPRDRELLAYLLRERSTPLGSEVLDLVLFGFESQINGHTDKFSDDNFPWMDSEDSNGDFQNPVRCQFMLSSGKALHVKLKLALQSLTQDRQADVLRRLALIGLRIGNDHGLSISSIRVKTSMYSAKKNGNIELEKSPSDVPTLGKTPKIHKTADSIAYSVPKTPYAAQESNDNKFIETKGVVSALKIDEAADGGWSDEIPDSIPSRLSQTHVADLSDDAPQGDDIELLMVPSESGRTGGASELKGLMGMVWGMTDGKMIRPG